MTSLQNVLVLLLKYVFWSPLSVRTQISTLTHMHAHTQSPVRIMLKDLGHLLHLNSLPKCAFLLIIFVFHAPLLEH